MALSEPHAGSSLATIRTMAVPEADADGGTRAGAYRVRGTKMWTTGAFHDLSHNIVRILMALDGPRVALLASEITPEIAPEIAYEIAYEIAPEIACAGPRWAQSGAAGI